ncbi:hypothetical protein PRIPAC_95946, partial [Pristionchus pacificus]|uniref:Uncharacterized protein n=1 Tax=Pristionchus pacificus TaxID=54126 RepID=A0A2A6BCM1_PRIPA
ITQLQAISVSLSRKKVRVGGGRVIVMAFITPFVSRQYAGVYPIKSPMEPRHSPEKQRIVINDLSAPSIEKLVESPSSSRRSSQRSDRSSRADSITELRREIAAAKPRPRTVSEGKSLDTLVAEKDQRLAELKRRKQQNIRRRHTMTLRKISEQYETRLRRKRRRRRRQQQRNVAIPSDGASPSSSAGCATSAPELLVS